MKAGIEEIAEVNVQDTFSFDMEMMQSQTDTKSNTHSIEETHHWDFSVDLDVPPKSSATVAKTVTISKATYSFNIEAEQVYADLEPDPDNAGQMRYRRSKEPVKYPCTFQNVLSNVSTADITTKKLPHASPKEG